MNNSVATFKKNSNTIYSSTDSDWTRVRNGSFIKFQSSSDLFTVTGKQQHDFLKSFDRIANATVEIKGDCSDILSPGDVVKLSKKEYSVSEFFVKSGGSGYAKGDILEVAEELAVKDKRDNNSLCAIFKVEEVDSEGRIIVLNATSKGRYFVEEEKKQFFLMKGGYGSGAEVEITFAHNGQIKYLEKTVLEVDYNNISTKVVLDSNFEDYTTRGKLSFSKWSLTTKHPLTNNSLYSTPISITRDFTPHLKLPIVPGTNDVLESHYNKAISILDQKIEQLEKRINKL